MDRAEVWLIMQFAVTCKYGGIALMQDQKSVDRILTRLFRLVDNGDISSVEEALKISLTDTMVSRIRERKLIARLSAKMALSLIEALRRAPSLLDDRKRVEFFYYLEFHVRLEGERSRLLELVRKKLMGLLTWTTAEFVDLVQLSMEHFTEALLSQSMLEGDATVAMNERSLHHLNGAVNDIALAVARTVNEWAKLRDSNDRSLKIHRREALEVLDSLISMCSQINALEWYIDSVCFGDMVVAAAFIGENGFYQIDFADRRRKLLRELAIRRKVVLHWSASRERRFVREMLAEVETDALSYATRFYRRRVGLPSTNYLKIDKAHELSQSVLRQLEAEDDLLLAASNFAIQTQAFYFAAVSLRWFAFAFLGMQESVSGSKKGKRGAIGSIPIEQITSRFDDRAGGELIKNAVTAMVCTIPARTHHELFAKPYVRVGESVIPMFGGDTGLWNVSVRECLIDGGVLGKDLGTIWEDFYAKSFEQSDWRVVGRNVKLKRDGRLVTDIDLLIARNDLLLVVQIKAMIGSAATIYDHWKNRQTVEFGCIQARKASQHLSENKHELIGICGKKYASGIRFIQPAVLTNCNELNGWSFENVPIISEVTRKAITVGSKVEYFQKGKRNAVHTHHFVTRDELTTSKILELLTSTVELDIAAETGEISWQRHEVGSLAFLLPEFTAGQNLDEPIHEPARRVDQPLA
ncbi:hypothetical protein MJ904_22180 [Massilia sp. MB5]|uniref:hypothetical protein n=1 Tax=Massilia sp. MB5 TaxID=2919578 RepID=UPI001F106A34|nr:hypothetical protein [Massilia sp. MB5]UMR29722.1 hypothetical protein MJ904_22180 [Massilia sp. MB5]